MTSMPELSDQSERTRIQTDLDTTFIVEAAAGTGKTTQLVGRIISVLRSGRARLAEIAAVTFTEKAAGEMKLRLRGEIENARRHGDTTDDERERLVAALSELEVARIGTIHSLCSDILHERPIEAGVDPQFQVAPAEEAQGLFEAAFEAWFHRIVADPPEGVRRVLRRRRASSMSSGPQEMLREAGWKLAELRDFSGPWEQRPFERDNQIDQLMVDLDVLAGFIPQAKRSDDKLLENFEDVRRFVGEALRKEKVQKRDYDALEADLRSLAGRWSWRRRGFGTMFSEDMARADVLARRDETKANLDKFVEDSEADIAALLHRDLQPLIHGYEELKARAGRLDFLDLLLKARDLIVDKPDVRAGLQEQIKFVFVDEFQDTDPLQAEILVLMSADDKTEADWTKVRPIPGKLFIVGDPKQSIYRFRRADIALYEETKRRLQEHGAELLYLRTSFRSVPSIQQAVNASFAPVMKPEGETLTQAEYVALEPFREEAKEQPSVVALPVPRPYDEWGKVRKYKVNDSLPDAVAAYVDWLIHDSGWTVTERDKPDERVPLSARHICLLFRRFRSFRDDMTRLYRRGLEARRIPHVLVGGRSFHEREEILALRNALQAIEWPDDEFSVFATLRGPFFALGDDALLAWRHRFYRLNPLKVVPDTDLSEADGTAEVAAALQVLHELYRNRNKHPIADTIGRLLEAVRAHAGLAIWPSGEQALANVLRIMDIARRFEAAGATSFRSFVERMIRDAEAGQATEAPVVEEGTDGVRIMTVHQAKGLEFPVVILCDPSASKVRKTPSRYVDAARRIWAEPIAGGCAPPILLEHREEALLADEHESVRLAYVAATRARDVLVVPVVGDEETPGWLDAMNVSVYPNNPDRRDAVDAPGTPKFGGDSVLTRPLRANRDAGDSVKPGRHTPQAGDHRVVWWDPKNLELGKELDGGLRQDKLLQADEEEVVAGEGVRAHADWKSRRESALAAGIVPTLPAAAVTGDDPPGLDLPHEIMLEDTGTDRSTRPRGKRFGILVHELLAAVNLEADESAIETAAATQSRLLGAPAAETRAAQAAVHSALAHDLMKRAAKTTHRRETPIVLKLADGTLVEGVIDLAFKDDNGWTVVDFKTDHDPQPNRPLYEAQLRLYVEAISQATGEPTRGILLWV